MITSHLTPEPVWRDHGDRADYYPEAFADEGFVHCTNGDGLVLDVGNRYYRDDPRPYLLLDVDLSRVASTIRFEDDARSFPHIHGPIERDAIVRIRRVERAADGAFLAAGEAIWHRAE